jgi:hypothetical protein
MSNTYSSAWLNLSLLNKKEILPSVLLALWPRKKLLSSKTQMRQVRRLPLYNPVPPQRKIKWSPLCSLWRKPSCQLQGLYGTSNRTPSHHFVQKSTLPLTISNKPYILNQELHMHKSPNTILLPPSKWRWAPHQRFTSSPLSPLALSTPKQWHSRAQNDDERPLWPTGINAKPPQDRPC